MPRTTPAAVKEIMAPGGDYRAKTAPSLNPFIDSASATIDDLVYEAEKTNNPWKELLTPTRLEMIERWLAAHDYQQSDKGYTSRSTQGASGSFQGQWQMGLDSTSYGQRAKALDPTGLLPVVMDKNMQAPIVGGQHIGSPGSAREDYQH